VARPLEPGELIREDVLAARGKGTFFFHPTPACESTGPDAHALRHLLSVYSSIYAGTLSLLPGLAFMHSVLCHRYIYLHR
jgi:hypothetical protein